MKKPPEPTGKKRGKRAELEAWIARERPERIGEEEFGRIRGALDPVSESYLRKLLKETGVALSPMIEGVRQATIDDLEASLGALLDEYLASDGPRKQAIRKIVIAAKDRARWRKREEAVLWMTTWLENPPVFRTWARIRRTQIA